LRALELPHVETIELGDSVAACTLWNSEQARGDVPVTLHHFWDAF
jgi:hypothetical protein